MIDEALKIAEQRLGRTAEVAKTASAQDDLTKEASEVAEALEFLAFHTAGDGAAGNIKQAMVRSFFAKSAEGAGPAVTSTSVSGKQSPAPDGKAISSCCPCTGCKNGRPCVSSAPEGKMPENIMRAMPPAVTKTPLDKSAHTSLYEMLMSGKEAAAGGPAVSDSEDSAGVSGDTNIQFLSSNSAPAATTRAQTKAVARAKLSDVWSHAGCTTSKGLAAATFPTGVSAIKNAAGPLSQFLAGKRG